MIIPLGAWRVVRGMPTRISQECPLSSINWTHRLLRPGGTDHSKRSWWPVGFIADSRIRPERRSSGECDGHDTDCDRSPAARFAESAGHGGSEADPGEARANEYRTMITLNAAIETRWTSTGRVEGLGIRRRDWNLTGVAG